MIRNKGDLGIAHECLAICTIDLERNLYEIKHRNGNHKNHNTIDDDVGCVAVTRFAIVGSPTIIAFHMAE